MKKSSRKQWLGPEGRLIGALIGLSVLYYIIIRWGILPHFSSQTVAFFTRTHPLRSNLLNVIVGVLSVGTYLMLGVLKEYKKKKGEK